MTTLEKPTDNIKKRSVMHGRFYGTVGRSALSLTNKAKSTVYGGRLCVVGLKPFALDPTNNIKPTVVYGRFAMLRNIDRFLSNYITDHLRWVYCARKILTIFGQTF